MAIYRILEKSAFAPEAVRSMRDAYEQALKQLGLKDRNDRLTETVAKLIIEVAQTGEKDSSQICLLVLKRLAEPSEAATNKSAPSTPKPAVNESFRKSR